MRANYEQLYANTSENLDRKDKVFEILNWELTPNTRIVLYCIVSYCIVLYCILVEIQE